MASSSSQASPKLQRCICRLRLPAQDTSDDSDTSNAERWTFLNLLASQDQHYCMEEHCYRRTLRLLEFVFNPILEQYINLGKDYYSMAFSWIEGDQLPEGPMASINFYLSVTFRDAYRYPRGRARQEPLRFWEPWTKANEAMNDLLEHPTRHQSQPSTAFTQLRVAHRAVARVAEELERLELALTYWMGEIDRLSALEKNGEVKPVISMLDRAIPIDEQAARAKGWIATLPTRAAQRRQGVTLLQEGHRLFPGTWLSTNTLAQWFCVARDLEVEYAQMYQYSEFSGRRMVPPSDPYVRGGAYRSSGTGLGLDFYDFPSQD